MDKRVNLGRRAMLFGGGAGAIAMVAEAARLRVRGHHGGSGAGIPPIASVKPQIQGVPVTGATMTLTDGIWSSGSKTGKVLKRNGVPISGYAGGGTYVAQVADEGQVLTLDVTFTNSAGSATSTSDPVTFSAPGSVPLLAPRPAWNGGPGTGFDVSHPIPLDPTRNTAKPMLRMASAWGVRISSSTYRIFIDAECLGAQPGSAFGIASVNGYLEGSTGQAAFGRYTYPHPATGTPVSVEAYAVDIDVAAAVAAHANGGVDLYVDGIPVDWDGAGGTMQKRVIGPFRFYPRATAFTGTYDVGAGQTYATRKLAIAAIVAANEEAPCIIYHDNGHEEAEDCSAYGGYNGLKGKLVEKTAPGIARTIGRSVFPTGLAEGAMGWDPGPDGIEWGPGITLDPRNWSFIVNHDQIRGDGLRHGHRLNGCKVVNSEGTLNSYYWNGRPRPSGIWTSMGFMEDCVIQHMVGATSTTFLCRNVALQDNLREQASNCYYQQHIYLSGWDAYTFWFTSTNNYATLSYTGTGVGRMWVTGFGIPDTRAVWHFSTDGVETHTITAGVFSTDPNFNATQMAVTVNGFGDGWHMTVTMSNTDGPNMSQASGVNIDATTDGGANPTVVTSTPAILRASYDFHQDYWHSIGQTVVTFPYTTGPNEGSIFRDVSITGETAQPQNQVVPAFTRIDTSISDVAFINCSMSKAFGTDSSSVTKSHILMRGCVFARDGWTPAPGYDLYSRFELSVVSIFWQAGTITWPAMINNYIVTTATGVPAALAPPQHTGNIVVQVGDFNTQVSTTRALFVNVDVADFRPNPAGALALLANKRPRTGPDAGDNAFAASDAIGSNALGQTAISRPF